MAATPSERDRAHMISPAHAPHDHTHATPGRTPRPPRRRPRHQLHPVPPIAPSQMAINATLPNRLGRAYAAHTGGAPISARASAHPFRPSASRASRSRRFKAHLLQSRVQDLSKNRARIASSPVFHSICPRPQSRYCWQEESRGTVPRNTKVLPSLCDGIPWAPRHAVCCCHSPAVISGA